MIPASGAGGRGFDSPNSPFLVFWCRPERSSRRSRVGARASFASSFQRLRRRRCAASTSPQSTADGGDDHDAHSDVRVSRAWRRVSRVRGRGPRGGSARAFAPPRPYPASWPAAVHARARRPSRAGRALLSRILARASLASPREPSPPRLLGRRRGRRRSRRCHRGEEARDAPAHHVLLLHRGARLRGRGGGAPRVRGGERPRDSRAHLHQPAGHQRADVRQGHRRRALRAVGGVPSPLQRHAHLHHPTHEQAHPKLSLRYKPQLVQLEGGTCTSPCTTLPAAAPP